MTYSEASKRINELLDKEFLAKLVEVGKLYGWSGDYAEISGFIRELHGYVGIENVDTEPYGLEND